jgi:biopolymer transport protein ExbB
MEQYGLGNIWENGDFATRGILVVLTAMSIASWLVIVIKFYRIARIRRATAHTDARFRQSGSFDDAWMLERHNDPLLALARAGYEAAEHHRDTPAHLSDRIDVSDWIERRLQDTMDETIVRMQGGLALLASIGSTAPFVGLFGTVWGIYHALLVISETGQTSIDQVAGPVGESLIMTAFGLFVAIPAVLGYNALTRANRDIVTTLRRFAHRVHAYFVAGLPLGVGRSGALDAATEAGTKANDDAFEWQ